MVKEYDYNSIYPDIDHEILKEDHEKLKEDHEQLKKLYYEVCSLASKRKRRIDQLESYNDELIRDNNQLRRTINIQEFMSQEWRMDL